MSPVNAVIWTFLAIFVATAIIALGSLPGWIRVPEKYRSKLFTALILEVVACVVGFAGVAFAAYNPASRELRSVLLSQEFGWDWQYAQKGWRSRVRFESTPDGRIQMVGDTSIVDRGDPAVSIIKWESAEPFIVPEGAKSVSFAAHRTYTAEAASAYHELRGEVGKVVTVQITLQPDVSLRGPSTGPSSTETWGMVLTSGFPR